MSANRTDPPTLPANFDSLDELDAFWSTHSVADYSDKLEPVSFRVRLDDADVVEAVAVAPEIARRLRRRAQGQGISVGQLLDQLLDRALTE